MYTLATETGNYFFIITTIKIGWCVIRTNIQLVSITTNYHQLRTITANYYQLKMIIIFWTTIYFISKFYIEINLKKRFFTLNYFHFHHFIVLLLTVNPRLKSHGKTKLLEFF